MKTLLTTREVAQILKLAPDTVHKWRQRGEGPPYHVIAGRIRYDQDELKSWVEGKRARQEEDKKES